MRLTQAEFNTIFLALQHFDDPGLFPKQRKKIYETMKSVRLLQKSQSLKHRVQVSIKRRSK